MIELWGWSEQKSKWILLSQTLWGMEEEIKWLNKPPFYRSYRVTDKYDTFFITNSPK